MNHRIPVPLGAGEMGDPNFSFRNQVIECSSEGRRTRHINNNDDNMSDETRMLTVADIYCTFAM